MSAEAEHGAAAAEARALRALEISGRRLARLRDGRWGVLTGGDRRRRPMSVLMAEQVERLAESGALTAVDEHSYVLASPQAHPYAPSVPATPRWIFVAEAVRRPGGRSGGIGFAGLATLAREGRGPLSMRQVLAGLRLVTDAERAAADQRLTMNWDAGPATQRRRMGSDGGLRGDARAAARVLAQISARLGVQTWSLLWRLCVDGDALDALKTRFGISQRDIHASVSRALEKLAEAYDG